jgi:uncharacterized lipoprotein YbaY/heat shock protein HslJ
MTAHASTHSIQPRMVLAILFIPALAFLVVACMPITPPVPTPTTTESATAMQETATMTTTSSAGATGSELIGTVWQWQKTQMNDDTSTTPEDPTKYTLTFLTDGSFQVQADCNRGRGIYTVDGTHLTLRQGIMTLMACLPGSLDTLFLKQLGQTSTYLLSQGNLVLELEQHTGTMTFMLAQTNTEAGETSDVATTPMGSATLTGTVTYRQRIALPPGSVVEVQLQDVSKADAAAVVIASQTITTTGENVPIPFTLTYDPAQIDPRSTYALSVRITIAGQLRWINTERYAVLTGGAPTTGVEVIVQPAP